MIRFIVPAPFRLLISPMPIVSGPTLTTGPTPIVPPPAASRKTQVSKENVL